MVQGVLLHRRMNIEKWLCRLHTSAQHVGDARIAGTRGLCVLLATLTLSLSACSLFESTEATGAGSGARVDAGASSGAGERSDGPLGDGKPQATDAGSGPADPSSGPADAGLTPGTDAGTTPTPDAGAAAAQGLSALKLSAGTLSPAFAQGTTSYRVATSVVTVSVPITLTPTIEGGSVVTINGTKVASGTASPVIDRKVSLPTSVEVVETPPAGVAKRYTVTIPPIEEALLKRPASFPKTSSDNPFGSIAIDGDTLAVANCPANVVSIFARTGATWVQQTLLKASGLFGCNYGGIGNTLALVGDTLVVGVPFDSLSDCGRVLVYRRRGTSWTLEGTVSDTVPCSAFGFGQSLALEKDTLVVGNNGLGAVNVFRRAGSSWVREATITNDKSHTYFGQSVAILGDTLVIGAALESSGARGINGNESDLSAANSGAVFVYVRKGATWSRQAYIKASNTKPVTVPPGAEYGVWFGWSVALSGDTLAVGAPNEGTGGAIYTFARSGTNWTEQAYLPSSSAYVGWTVAMQGDALFSSTYDRARLTLFSRKGTLWSPPYVLPGTRAGFGSALALSGDTLAGIDSLGNTYVFR
jgi:FG-GAP repeat